MNISIAIIPLSYTIQTLIIPLAIASVVITAIIGLVVLMIKESL